MHVPPNNNRWMPLDEFARTVNHPMIQAAVRVASGEGGVPLCLEEHPSVVPGRGPYKLYYAAK